jgi:hypothetical protein
MADLQELPSLRAAPMHPRDRLLLAAFNWAGNVGGPLAVGCYIAWAIDQMPLRLAAPGVAVGLLAMTGATIYAFRERAPTKRGYFWPIMIGSIVLTWAVFSWQTWMWFHPSTQAVQGYTQAQLDDAKAKAKQDQLDQNKKDAAQQSADAVTKATALLRAQIAQLQSDTPVSIDKLTTSLTLSFKGGNVEQIGNAPNVVWTKMFGWQGPSILFGAGGNPSWVIVIVFKKPIAYKTFCFEGHNSGISTPAAEKNPYYAIITFDPGPLMDLSIYAPLMSARNKLFSLDFLQCHSIQF